MYGFIFPKKIQGGGHSIKTIPRLHVENKETKEKNELINLSPPYLPEGGIAVEKLVGHDAHRPQVDRLVVGHVADQLRGKVRLCEKNGHKIAGKTGNVGGQDKKEKRAPMKRMIHIPSGMRPLLVC